VADTKFIRQVVQGAKHLLGMDGNLMDFGRNPNGFSHIVGRSHDDNPASSYVRKFHPVPSDFQRIPSQSHLTGSFPGSNFRRAVYGLRRRRMPFFSRREGFGSVNPFRRANSFFNSPEDVMFPRQVWDAARNPKAFDAGRLAPDPKSNHLPYGGFSSFSDNAKLRNSRVSNGNDPFMVHAGADRWVPRYGSVRGFGPHEAALLSDGSPASFGTFAGINVGHASDPFLGGVNMRWDGEKFSPYVHPFAGGAPNFVPGDYTFWDFYGSSGVAAAPGAAAAAESA